MTTFRASIQGTGKAVSRCGSKHIITETNGCNVGIHVYGYINEYGEETFEVRLIPGYGYGYGEKTIGTFTAADLKI